jgi:hypothetical protein
MTPIGIVSAKWDYSIYSEGWAIDRCVGRSDSSYVYKWMPYPTLENSCPDPLDEIKYSGSDWSCTCDL